MMDGFGVMILAPSLQFIFSHYGYTGSIIIISGLMLHLTISASLFRSPDGKAKKSPQKDLEMRTSIVKNIGNAQKTIQLDDSQNGDGKQTYNGAIDCDQKSDENQMCQNGHSTSGNCKCNLEIDDQTSENKLSQSEHKGDCFCQIGKQSESETSKITTKEAPCIEYQKSRSCYSVFTDRLFKYLDLRLVRVGVFRSFCLVMGCSSFCFSTNNIHIAGNANHIFLHRESKHRRSKGNSIFKNTCTIRSVITLIMQLFIMAIHEGCPCLAIPSMFLEIHFTN